MTLTLALLLGFVCGFTLGIVAYARHIRKELREMLAELERLELDAATLKRVVDTARPSVLRQPDPVFSVVPFDESKRH